MSAKDDKHYQPRRYRAEVKRAKGHSKREKAQEISRITEPANDTEELNMAVLPADAAEVSEDITAPAVQPKEAEEILPQPSDEEPQEEEAQSSEPGQEQEEAQEPEPYVDKTVILPNEDFEYVVPKETFKQHLKRKHRSPHSGTTKAATKEEIDEAEAGYIFMTRRKHRKHKKRRHRHHKFRHLPLWKRILIIFASVVLILAILLSGTFLILREIGRRSLLNYDDVSVQMPSRDESGNEVIQGDTDGNVITYDGVSYELNRDLITIVVIGADEGTGDNAHLQMSDVIEILTIDTKTGAVRILGISRDTMTDVDLYSEEGNFIETDRMQISFSYAYGSDTVSGGKNTTTSLSRLFYGMAFKDYFAMNMDALITLNDTIGGVTLTSSMTFTSPIDGRTINKGDTVTLHGKEADYYVRSRDTEELASNSDRMQRQQEYIRAFLGSIIPAVKKDLSMVTKLYNEIKVNSDTTLDLPKMTYIASTALTKLRNTTDIEYLSLQGTITEGEYAELNVKNEDAIRTMLDVFYKPVTKDKK